MGDYWKQRWRIVVEVIRNGHPSRQEKTKAVWWQWLVALLGLLVALARSSCGDLLPEPGILDTAATELPTTEREEATDVAGQRQAGPVPDEVE